MIKIKDIKLTDLLPPNIAMDPKVRAAAEALDGELQSVTEAIKECSFFARIDKLPEVIIDFLSWRFHVDFYEPDLPIQVKRELVKKSIPWHRRKGTPVTVEELVAAIFDDARVVEWFEYGGEPYMFKVVTFNYSTTQEQAEEFLRALDAVKNTRSWLEAIEITITDDLPIYFAGIVNQIGRAHV